MRLGSRWLLVATLAAALVASGSPARSEERLTLATTTSVRDSGLLPAILPDFESREHVRVAVVAVGSGQALEIARRGDADAIVVHSPAAENAFMDEGHGRFRWQVMWNYFAVVGPASDPAGVRGAPSAKEAFRRIFAKEATFVSRGDDSGTHSKEKSLWAEGGLEPTSFGRWYKSIGQGMGATLRMAYELDAYTLSDEGTYWSIPAIAPEDERKSGLVILLGGLDLPADGLQNVYSVIPVSPEKHPNVKADLARRFAEWITSDETATKIGAFAVNGHQLFRPDPRRSPVPGTNFRIRSGGGRRER